MNMKNLCGEQMNDKKKRIRKNQNQCCAHDFADANNGALENVSCSKNRKNK